jgi:hypothetical protein
VIGTLVVVGGVVGVSVFFLVIRKKGGGSGEDDKAEA